MAEKATYEELEQRVKELEEELTRERVEDAFQESEAPYRVIFNAANDAIIIFDSERIIKAVNPQACRLYGYSHEEFLKLSGKDFAHPDYYHLYEEFFRDMPKHKEFHAESVELRKDGSFFNADIKGTPFDFKGEKHLLAIVRDITLQKQAEKALKASEDKYRTLVEHVNEIIFVQGIDHSLIYLSPQCEKITGYAPEEGIGLQWTSFATNNPANKLAYEIGERIMKTGETPEQPNLVEIRRKDGKSVFLEVSQRPLEDVTGKVAGIIGSARDVTERKQTREALEESERLYRMLADNATDVIWTADMNFRFTYVSPSNMELRGYTSDEVMGQALEDVLTSASYQHAAQALGEELAIENSTAKDLSRSRALELEMKCKDGSTVWTEVRVRFIRDSQGQAVGFLGVTRNIGERKQAENVLRESEARYRSLFENSRDAIVMTSRDGKYTDINQAALDLFGYTREEMLRINARETYANLEDRERFLKKIEPDGYVKDYELRLKKKDGTEMTCLTTTTLRYDDNGNVIGVQGIMRDITDQKRSQDALRESEDRFRNLFENSRDALFIVAEDGKHLDVNQAALDLFGYTREEMMALNARDRYVNMEDREKNRSLIKTQGFFTDIEVPYKKKDGTKMECLATATVRRDKDGNFLEYQNMIRDITDQRRMEAQLQQAQKMEAIGTLAGGIAHDFNNLLMGIQGHASLVSLGIDSDHPHSEHLNGIEEMVKRGADLTQQLLGFARRGKYDVKATNLNDLLLKSSQLFGRTKKELKISCSYQKGVWPVEVDRGQIEQALLNLYVNAWQAMPGGGELSLRTENSNLDERAARRLGLEPMDYVKISVADTGEGMDQETQKRIFDPFFTTKEMGTGTGLGLASAYGIIRNHSGALSVESEKDVGTTFTIYLPATEKQATEEKPLSQEVVGGTETILIVDDEDMILKVGETILKTLGYAVMTARSGKEALEVYKNNSDAIDMVILDMIMPVMKGGEVFDRLKKTAPDIKVLLSSGYSIDGHAAEILERGCDGFIQKPFNLGSLSQKIREILDKSPNDRNPTGHRTAR